MQHTSRLLGSKLMGSSFAFGPNDVVVIVEDENGIFFHHVRLGHGVAVPFFGGCSRSSHRLGARVKKTSSSDQDEGPMNAIHQL